MLPSFDARQLVMIAWALATLDHSDPAFMGALLAVAKPKLPSFTAADLRQMGIALEKLYAKDAVVARALAALDPDSTDAARMATHMEHYERALRREAVAAELGGSGSQAKGTLLAEAAHGGMDEPTEAVAAEPGGSQGAKGTLLAEAAHGGSSGGSGSRSGSGCQNEGTLGGTGTASALPV
jgi:hypothetical protein